ncbi:ethionine resistance protein [Coemansia sp. RSA 1939]|nr:ethionine resistance protein [Coemansia sp. RSA 1939]
MASTSNSRQTGDVQEIDERCIDHTNEATPLLRTSLSELDITISKNDTTESYFRAAKREFAWIASSASLTTLTLLLEMSFYTTNFLVVGRLGAKELGAMSLALTFQTVLAMGPTFGLVSAMDTFCSTAFTASRDKTLVGFHFQRGIIALVAHFILIAPVMWHSETMFLLLGQDPEIARLAGLFLRMQILSVLPFALFEATKRFMQAQGIMRAATIITTVVAPIHWINCYLFVLSDTYGMGYIGAPIVNAVSNWALLAGILLYVRKSPAAEAWGGWTAEAFRNLWVYYRFAIPAVFTTCSAWICFELLTLGASYFGAYQLASCGIMLNTLQILFLLSNGVGYGASPRIGNLVGAAKPRQARITAHVTILTSAGIGALGTVFMLLCSRWWISLYTSDPRVVYETQRLTPVACIFIMNDGLDAVLAAILRGLGRQRVSAAALVFGFYMCGMPVALYLGYARQMENVGLWWGACVGVFVGSSLQIGYILFGIDWKHEVRLCLLRLEEASKQM